MVPPCYLSRSVTDFALESSVPDADLDLHAVTKGAYSLGADSGNILVQNRMTGQLLEEKMQIYVVSLVDSIEACCSSDSALR